MNTRLSWLLTAIVFFVAPLTAQAGMYQKIYGTTDGNADTTVEFAKTFEELMNVEIASYADVFEEEVYTETHVASMFLNWVGVEAIGTVRTGEDSVRFGLRIDPLKTWAPDWIHYHVAGFPGSVDGLDGYQAQIEHVYSIEYWKFILRGFLDHDLSSREFDGMSTHEFKTEHEIAFRLSNLFSLIGEYRFITAGVDNHEFAVGIAMDYF